MTCASHILPCLPLTSQGEVTGKTRLGHTCPTWKRGLLSFPQADSPKTDSLRRGMGASSAIRPVFAFPPSPFHSPEPSHLLAGTTFQLNTLKTVLQAVLSETPRIREVLSGCGISEENPAWLPGKRQHLGGTLKLGRALVEGKPRVQKCPGHKEEELRVSETLCGWRLRERWQRSRRRTLKGFEC